MTPYDIIRLVLMDILISFRSSQIELSGVLHTFLFISRTVFKFKQIPAQFEMRDTKPMNVELLHFFMLGFWHTNDVKNRVSQSTGFNYLKYRTPTTECTRPKNPPFLRAPFILNFVPYSTLCEAINQTRHLVLKVLSKLKL